MVATVQIIEKNGAGGAATNKTGGTIRFKDADNANVDTGNPLPVPAADSVFSYEKWLRLNVTVAPGTNISNLKAYSDGGNGFGTGVSLWYRTTSAYATPVKPTDASGLADFFAKTDAAPVSLGAGPFTGVGEKGDHLVLALEVDNTASQGALPAETITFAYDEI